MFGEMSTTFLKKLFFWSTALKCAILYPMKQKKGEKV